MSVYTGLQATADALIRKKGAACTITRPASATFDPVTQANTPGATSDTFFAVGIPPGKTDEFKVGSLVGRKVLKFYIALKGKSMMPTQGDILAWGGVNYKLIYTGKLDPAADAPLINEALGEA